MLAVFIINRRKAVIRVILVQKVMFILLKIVLFMIDPLIYIFKWIKKQESLVK